MPSKLSVNEVDNRHYDMAPNAFRVGDVVEAQISFEVIRLKGKRQKMIVILRALTLLDKGALDASVNDFIEDHALNNLTECNQSTDQRTGQLFTAPNNFETKDRLS